MGCSQRGWRNREQSVREKSGQGEQYLRRYKEKSEGAEGHGEQYMKENQPWGVVCERGWVMGTSFREREREDHGE